MEQNYKETAAIVSRYLERQITATELIADLFVAHKRQKPVFLGLNELGRCKVFGGTATNAEKQIARFNYWISYSRDGTTCFVRVSGYEQWHECRILEINFDESVNIAYKGTSCEWQVWSNTFAEVEQIVKTPQQ